LSLIQKLRSDHKKGRIQKSLGQVENGTESKKGSFKTVWAEVGKVTLKSNGNEALIDESLYKEWR
jgi:hypothetical protein